MSLFFFGQFEKYIKLVIIWIVIMAVVGILYASFILPVHLKVCSREEEIAAQVKQVEDMIDYISESNLKRLRRSQDKLKDRLGTFVSGGQTVNECLYKISSIAEETGVSNFTAKQKSHSGFEKINNCQMLAAVNIEVSCSGSYIQFLRLMNAYERCRPIIVVDKFSFFKGDSENFKIDMLLTVLVDNRSGKLLSGIHSGR